MDFTLDKPNANEKEKKKKDRMKFPPNILGRRIKHRT